MTDLDIAVVIVTYKSADLTIEALASVALQRSTSDFQIRAIVVDNASGDSPQIALAIESRGWGSWVALVTSAKNGGFAYGNNLGIARAYKDRTPSYVYLLNPDAQVRPGALAALAHFMESHPHVGISGSSFENLDGSEWPLAFRFPTLRSEMLHGIEFGPLMRLFDRWVVPKIMSKTSQPIDWICGASMFIRPEVFNSIGGLDENYFLYYEETDFCYRALKAGFETWYVPDSRVMHIMGQSTTVTDQKKGPRRLPAYWFESRRRFFVMTYGLSHAIATDIATAIACSIGALTRLLLRRRHKATPHYIRDLISHSVLWPRNRRLFAVRSQLQVNCAPR